MFFSKGASKLVSSQLRKDLVQSCKNSQLFDYLVLLEANDNPYAVQERFEKNKIDSVFDYSRQVLLATKDLPLTLQGDTLYWARTALHLGNYFKAIGQKEPSILLYQRASELGLSPPETPQVAEEVAPEPVDVVMAETH